MRVEYFVHLPGISLAGSNETAFAQGRLVCLPFADWCELDDKFPFKAGDYEKSRPVFYTWQGEIINDLNLINDEEIFNKISERVSRVYRSFLLAPVAPLLPLPFMSVIYVRFEQARDGGITVKRFIGPFEREWIVFGNRIQWIFENSKISQVQRIYDFLTAFDKVEAFSGVDGGLHTLQLTAHPEFWLPTAEWEDPQLYRVNDFVHCIAAMERILLPDEDDAPPGMKLTTTFGQHAAALLNRSHDDLREQAIGYSAYYRLRSQLIHGEKGVSDLNSEERKMLPYGRLFLRDVIIGAIALRQGFNGDESLPALLARSYRDFNTHHDIFSKIEEVTTNDF